MKPKIIYLNEGTFAGRKFQKLLVKCGYAVETPKSLEELLLILKMEQVSIVIHAGKKPEAFGAFCEAVELENPALPILHILSEKCLKARSWLRGPLQDWLAPSTPFPIVVRHIESLIQLAQLHLEHQEYKRIHEVFEAFSLSVRSLESKVVIAESMKLLAVETKAENVLWFPLGSLQAELRKYMQKDMRGTLRPQGAESWQAHKALSEKEMDTIFKNWCTIAGSNSDVLGAVMEIQDGNAGDVILPLSEGCGEKIFGHFVLIAPVGWVRFKKKALFSHYIRLMRSHLQQAFSYEDVLGQTFKDDLTELYNQRYLPLILEQELKRSARSQSEFSVLFLDVDYFKSVNDSKGHMVGSKVLVELSKLFKRSIRSTDFAFRYGGDEYVIVLSRTNSTNARLVAERLRQRTAESTFKINGQQVNITVSIGIASFPEHANSTEELLSMADEAMYDGKNACRNVVFMAG